MTPHGPRPPGDGPDDPAGNGEGGGARHEPPRDGEGTAEGADHTDLKGWLPPDDRLWRHPSEVLATPGTAGSGGMGRGGAEPPAPAPLSPRHRRRHQVATALVGTGAAAAVAAGILLLVGTSSGTGPGPAPATGTPTLTEVTGCCALVPAAARAARAAMVSLQVSTGRGVVEDCGVVVAAGGLVATTLDAVADARSVTALTAGGRREAATVVATDRGSDVALLRVAGDPPVAQFADDTGVGHHAMVLAMASRSRAGGSITTMWSDGTVRSVGAAVTRGDAAGMAGIVAAAPSMPMLAGEILLQPDGRVLGILDTSGTPDGERATKVFLPAQLVVGVADDLAASGGIRHGWLDIEGENAARWSSSTTVTSTVDDATTWPATTAAGWISGGALVLKVDPAGASTSVLRPGDVILSVDDRPVRSMAELRSRLYPMAPGTRVELGIFRDGVPMTVAVGLSAAP